MSAFHRLGRGRGGKGGKGGKEEERRGRYVVGGDRDRESSEKVGRLGAIIIGDLI